MINLMIGPPGGGKSYEAVVYHVLPSIEDGRKVITNLSLNLDELARIEPRARALVEIRNRQGKAGEPATWAFGHVDDYLTDWRHPETQQGPLFVIDECHKPLARRSQFRPDPSGVAVDDWYAEHRHTGADLLLMTQSYGKVSKNIVDQVQTCYRVKKMTAFGDSSGYIRKVQDGVRGDVLSTAERTYEAKWFPLYKSHTRVQSAVIEADAKDIKPAFLAYQRAAKAVFAVAALILCWSSYTFFADDPESGTASAATTPLAAGEGEGGSARKNEHAAAAEAAAPPPAPKPRAVTVTQRLVGIVDLPHNAHAIIWDGSTEKRVPLYLCGRIAFTGWSCHLDGQDVTFTTGPQPKGEGGILRSLAGGITSAGS